MARLTAPQVRQIIAAEGSHREVAARFGTNAMTVSRIRRGTGYPGVDRTTPPPNSYTVADALEYLRAFPAGLVAGVVSSPPYNKGGRGNRMGSAGTNWRAAYRPGGLGQGYAAPRGQSALAGVCSLAAGSVGRMPADCGAGRRGLLELQALVSARGNRGLAGGCAGGLSVAPGTHLAAEWRP